MSMNTRRSDELLMKALNDATDKGYLHQIPLDHPILARGLTALDEQQSEEKEEQDMREWPHWANWRLTLGAGEHLQAVYFIRKPTYQEKKAFCAAAGVSPETVELEERL